MLKKIWRLFLGLVVCMGSACVTPTHASSAVSGVILTHVQAGITGDPTNEMVAIYNNTDIEVDITDWCFASSSVGLFACFIADQETAIATYVLPPYASAVVATQEFLDTRLLSADQVSLVYVPSNQRSGSLTGNGDTVSLLNAQDELQDSYAWTKAASSGKVALRDTSKVNEFEYDTVGENAGWLMGELREVPQHQVQVYWFDNPDGVPVDDADVPRVHPIIIELLPDPNGADAGQEFIELYNPSEAPISLDDYKLRIGKNLEKSHRFPVGATIEPASYAVYSNADIKYSLLNSASALQLEYKGEPAGDMVTYEMPPTGQSWALIQAVWQYTTLPTPGQQNIIGPPSTMLTKDALAPKPCAPNQYRNPATNRCRLIATASSKVQPCKPGQVRNPATNRCRAATSAVKTLTPCKEGQERNPDTNRCRTVPKMVSASHGVQGVTTQQTQTSWYVWLGIVGAVGCILAYAIWEWRVELKTAMQWLRRKLIH